MPGFMDTFFFLSLGIAFVLILLLVYHFKQRLTATENKCDTMFEIINGLASEVNNMKGALIARAPPRPVQMPPQMGGMPLPPGPMFSNMSNENVNKANIQDLENDDEITEEVINKSKSFGLKAIVKWGIGVDNIDKLAAKNNKGKSTIKRLFNKIKKNPGKFITRDQLVKNKYRAISDFISGMTDRYAINLNNNYK